MSPTDRSDAPAVDGDGDAASVVRSGAVESSRTTPPDDGDARARLGRIRRLSTLLDSAITIPRTRITVGLDPILGLVPGVGDLVPAAASAYIVAEAAALGVPRVTLLRMCLNLLVDAVVGSIPLVGDAVDAAWRANDRNVRLLEARLADPSGTRRDGVAVAALGGVVFLTVLAVGLAGVAAAWWLLGVTGVV